MTAGHSAPPAGVAAVAAGTVLVTAAGLLATSARRAARLSWQIRWDPPEGHWEQRALAVRRLGQGLPATVLLHGMCASGRYWGGAYDDLADQAALVVPDLAGFGRSLHASDGFGPDEHADLVARTIRESDAGETPAMVGAHSLGCLVALRLARRHPELVAGIVAFSPPLYRDEGSARRHLARANALLGLFVASPALSRAVCEWVCAHRHVAARVGRWVRPDLPAPLAEDRFQHTYRSYSETLAEVVISAGAAAEIGALAVPVHLVAGAGDTLLDHRFLRELADRHGHVHLSVWEGSEHELPLTAPSRCVELLRGLRAELASRADRAFGPVGGTGTRQE
jgi:pimeloyl-ACP methyl ester carboxylesterase